MDSTAHKFRKLLDSLKGGEILVPILEKELIAQGPKVFENEYLVPVRNKERKPDGYFHPSSHANAPDLLLYYEFHPKYDLKRDPLTRDMTMAFQVGSVYHSMLQSMLIKLGLTTKEEVEVSFVSEKRHCTGMLDVRKVTLPSDRHFPLEIKSAAYLPTTPQPSYLRQFQVYMDIGCGEPQDEGLILYIEKAYPHRFREFLIKRDEPTLKAIYDKWNRVLEAIDVNSIDGLEFPCHEKNSKAHRECSARNVCILGRPS